MKESGRGHEKLGEDGGFLNKGESLAGSVGSRMGNWSPEQEPLAVLSCWGSLGLAPGLG